MPEQNNNTRKHEALYGYLSKQKTKGLPETTEDFVSLMRENQDAARKVYGYLSKRQQEGENIRVHEDFEDFYQLFSPPDVAAAPVETEAAASETALPESETALPKPQWLKEATKRADDPVPSAIKGDASQQEKEEYNPFMPMVYVDEDGRTPLKSEAVEVFSATGRNPEHLNIKEVFQDPWASTALYGDLTNVIKKEEALRGEGWWEEGKPGERFARELGVIVDPQLSDNALEEAKKIQKHLEKQEEKRRLVHIKELAARPETERERGIVAYEGYAHVRNLVQQGEIPPELGEIGVGQAYLSYLEEGLQPVFDILKQSRDHYPTPSGAGVRHPDLIEKLLAGDKLRKPEQDFVDEILSTEVSPDERSRFHAMLGEYRDQAEVLHAFQQDSFEDFLEGQMPELRSDLKKLEEGLESRYANIDDDIAYVSRIHNEARSPVAYDRSSQYVYPDDYFERSARVERYHNSRRALKSANRVLSRADHYLKQQDKSSWKQLTGAIGYAAKMDWWNASYRHAADALHVEQIINQVDEDGVDSLTDEQTALLLGMEMLQMASSLDADAMSDVGDMVGHMIPFITQLGLTRGAWGMAAQKGIENQLKRSITNKMIKTYGANSMKYLLARGGVKGIAYTLSTGTMTPAFSQFWENVGMEKAKGIHVDVNESTGKIELTDVKPEEGDGAYTKAAVRTFFQVLVSRFVIGGTKYLPRATQGAVQTKVGKRIVENNPSVRWVSDNVQLLQKASGDGLPSKFNNIFNWSGVGGQYGEEVIAMGATNAVLGDREWGEFFDTQEQWRMFLSIALVGGTMIGTNAGLSQAKTQLSNFQDAHQKSVFNKLKPDVRSAVDNLIDSHIADPEAMFSEFANMFSQSRLATSEQRAILDYAHNQVLLTQAQSVLDTRTEAELEVYNELSETGPVSESTYGKMVREVEIEAELRQDRIDQYNNPERALPKDQRRAKEQELKQLSQEISDAHKKSAEAPPEAESPTEVEARVETDARVDAAPRVEPDVTPETTPDVAPEVTPEVTPETRVETETTPKVEARPPTTEPEGMFRSQEGVRVVEDKGRPVALRPDNKPMYGKKAKDAVAEYEAHRQEIRQQEAAQAARMDTSPESQYKPVFEHPQTNVRVALQPDGTPVALTKKGTPFKNQNHAKARQAIAEYTQQKPPQTPVEGVNMFDGTVVMEVDGKPVAMVKDGSRPMANQKHPAAQRALNQYRMRTDPDAVHKMTKKEVGDTEIAQSVEKEMDMLYGYDKKINPDNIAQAISSVFKGARRALPKDITSSLAKFKQGMRESFPSLKALPDNVLAHVYNKDVLNRDVGEYSSRQFQDGLRKNITPERVDLLKAARRKNLTGNIPNRLVDVHNTFLDGFNQGSRIEAGKITNRGKDALKKAKNAIDEILSHKEVRKAFREGGKGRDITNMLEKVNKLFSKKMTESDWLEAPQKIDKAIGDIKGLISEIERQAEVNQRARAIEGLFQSLKSYREAVNDGQGRLKHRVSMHNSYLEKMKDLFGKKPGDGIVGEYNVIRKNEYDSLTNEKSGEQAFTKQEAALEADSKARHHLIEKLHKKIQEVENRMSQEFMSETNPETASRLKEELTGELLALNDVMNYMSDMSSKGIFQLVERVKKAKSDARAEDAKRVADAHFHIMEDSKSVFEHFRDLFRRDEGKGVLTGPYKVVSKMVNMRGWINEFGVKLSGKNAVFRAKDGSYINRVDGEVIPMNKDGKRLTGKEANVVLEQYRNHQRRATVMSADPIGNILYSKWVKQAEDTFDRLTRQGKEVNEHILKNVRGLKTQKQVERYTKRLSTDENTGAFIKKVDGTLEQLVTNRGVAMYWLMAAKDPHMSAMMFAPAKLKYDAKAETNSNIDQRHNAPEGGVTKTGMGFTTETIQALEAFVGKQDLQVAEALAESIRKRGERWNEVYIEKTGRAMFSENTGQYVPKHADVPTAEVQMDVAPGDVPSVNSRHMIARKSTYGGLARKSLFEVHDSYVKDANRFEAFHDMVRVFNSVFTNHDVREYMNNRYGEEFSSQWKWLVKNTAHNMPINYGILDSAVNPFRVGALGYSLVTGMKQLVSTLYYLPYMNVADMTRFTADVPMIATELIMNRAAAVARKKGVDAPMTNTVSSKLVDTLLETDYFMHRIQGRSAHFGADYRLFNDGVHVDAIAHSTEFRETWAQIQSGEIKGWAAARKGTSTALKDAYLRTKAKASLHVQPEINQALRWSRTVGGAILSTTDQFPIIVGGAAYIKRRYRDLAGKRLTTAELDAIAEGKSNQHYEQAMSDWFLIAEGTQQSIRKSNQAQWRVESSGLRALHTFTSGPYQMFLNRRHHGRAMLEATKRGDMKGLSGHLSGYAMYAIVSPLIYDVIDRAFYVSQDDDNWWEKDGVLTMAEGMTVHGIPIVGPAAGGLFDMLKGRPWGDRPPTLPVVDAFFGASVDALRYFGALRDPYVTNEEKNELGVKAGGSLSQLFGVNAPTIIRTHGNWVELFDKDYDGSMWFQRAVGMNVNYAEGIPAWEQVLGLAGMDAHPINDVPLKEESFDEFWERVSFLNDRQGEEIRLDMGREDVSKAYRVIYRAGQAGDAWAVGCVKEFESSIWSRRKTPTNLEKLMYLQNASDRKNVPMAELVVRLGRYGYNVSDNLKRMVRVQSRDRVNLQTEEGREQLEENTSKGGSGMNLLQRKTFL